MKQIFSDNQIEFEDSNQAYIDFLSLHFREHKVKDEAKVLNIKLNSIDEWKDTSVAKVKNLAKTNKMFEPCFNLLLLILNSSEIKNYWVYKDIL